MGSQEVVKYTFSQRFALATKACADFLYSDIRFNTDGSVDVLVKDTWKTAFTYKTATAFLATESGKNLSSLGDLFHSLGSLRKETPTENLEEFAGAI